MGFQFSVFRVWGLGFVVQGLGSAKGGQSPKQNSGSRVIR